MNSFGRDSAMIKISLRSVARAVEYEVARQIHVLESGGQVSIQF
jgi:Asp-tRNA(Asn)/Glu-tRNA(Gln) amidotransferase B subunit